MNVNETKVLPCSCKNTYQDTKYGQFKRVHISVSSKSGTISYRCTVCSTEHSGFVASGPAVSTTKRARFKKGQKTKKGGGKKG